MRYKRVLLVQPLPKAFFYDPHLPVGLGYIAEALKRAAVEYDCLDMGLGLGMKDLRQKIDFFRPDMIGVGMKTYMYQKAYDLMNHIKRLYPKIKIVAGGAHISTVREKALQDCPAIDYGAVREGEATIVELCQDRPFEEIRGLLFKDRDKIVDTGDRDFQNNLDAVPYPRYEKFNLERYLFSSHIPIPICSSRGCPYQCIYCSVACASGRKFRSRSAGHVVEELAYWYKSGYRSFTFVDDNFTLLPQRVYEICEEIEQKQLLGLRLHCFNGVRADKVDRRLLESMKRAGFCHLSLGVEAGNNKVLKILKKSETIEQIERAIRQACDLGYEVTLYFLFGSPGETWDDLRDSIRLALKYPVSSAAFQNLIPFPHTELYAYIEENHLFIYPPEKYYNSERLFKHKPLFVTPEMPLEMRRKAIKLLRRTKRKVRCNYYMRVFNGHARLAGPLAVMAAWAEEKRIFKNQGLRRLLRGLKKLLLRIRGTGISLRSEE
jgi:anaerobic magnesium-protoporphyrin IX monomethyl ester cyclase